MLVVVAQNPANKMKDGDPPFEGTKSKDVLIGWLREIVADPNTQILVCNASKVKGKVGTKDYDKDNLRMLYGYSLNKQVRFISLGNYAEKYLNYGKIKNFKLPHPSGRNRKLNDPEFIASKLKECKEYLYGKQT